MLAGSTTMLSMPCSSTSDAATGHRGRPGTRGQAALVIHTPNGVTPVLNDLVGNIRHSYGFGGWLLRVTGFAGNEPHTPKPVTLMLIEDKEALRIQLLQWAELDSLKRILMSHGAPIEDHPGQALRALAASLARCAPVRTQSKRPERRIAQAILGSAGPPPTVSTGRPVKRIPPAMLEVSNLMKARQFNHAAPEP